MIPRGLKVGDTFTDGGRLFEVTKVGQPPYLYESKVVTKKTKEIPVIPELIPEVKEEVKEEVQEVFEYTKTQINRMNTADLEKVCDKYGVEKGTGASMKKALINKFNL